MQLKNPAGRLLAAFVSIAAVGLASSGSDTRLADAVKSRDTAAVKALLKPPVDVNAAQGDGATALHWAAHWDDLAMADLLIHAGADAREATTT